MHRWIIVPGSEETVMWRSVIKWDKGHERNKPRLQWGQREAAPNTGRARRWSPQGLSGGGDTELLSKKKQELCIIQSKNGAGRSCKVLETLLAACCGWCLRCKWEGEGGQTGGVVNRAPRWVHHAGEVGPCFAGKPNEGTELIRFQFQKRPSGSWMKK